MVSKFSSNPQIKIFDNFVDLVTTSFVGLVNAHCWQRDLNGDFEEIVRKLSLKEEITEISIDELLRLNLSEQGNRARNLIINDIELLTKHGAQPSLNLLKSYEKDTEFDFISTDVYSFHVDRSPFASDTFLCTYFGASSDIIPNHQATQKIKIPEIRKKLNDFYDGPESEFDDFLKENFFDLHYQADDEASIINLGNGHLWRLSVYPNQKVPPCIHRAPTENEEFRLLLIC